MASNAGGIRAGLAYVEMYLKDNPLTRGLDRAQKRLAAFGAGVKGVGVKVAGIGAALGAPLVLAAKKFSDYGSELNDMSERTGVSTDALQELGYAARLSGAGMEDVEQGVKFMQKSLEAAAGGGKEAKEAFKELGLTAAELQKLSPEDQFAAVAEKLSAIEPAAKRTSVALQLFGKGGQRLIPMLNGLAAARQEFKDMGLGLSPADVKRADEFGDNIGRMTDAIKLAVVAVGSGLEPAISGFLSNAMSGITTVGRWVKENQGLASSLLAVAAGIAAAGVSLIVLGEVAEGLGVILGGLGTVFGVAGKALGLLLTPTGAAVAALLALGAGAGVAFFTMTKEGQQATQQIGMFFSDLAQTVAQAWAGISDALEVGDLSAAFEIATAAANVAWKRFMASIGGSWQAALDGMLNALHAAIAGMRMLWNGFAATMAGTMATVSSKVGDIWTMMKADWEDIKTTLSNDSDAQKNIRYARTAQARNAELKRRAIEGNKTQEMLKQLRAADDVAAAKDVERAKAALNAAAGDKGQGALQQAQKDLEDAITKASIAKEQAWWDRFMRQDDRQAGKLSDKLQAALVTGTFNASVAGRMGGGQLALAQRQAAAAEKGVDLLRQANRNLEDIAVQAALGGIFFG